MKNILLSPATSSKLCSARAEWKKGPFQVETTEEHLNLESEDRGNDLFTTILYYR